VTQGPIAFGCLSKLFSVRLPWLGLTRQQHSCDNRDDRDHYEQPNEGKTTATHSNDLNLRFGYKPEETSSGLEQSGSSTC
jgi:hypothetical protein